jgi:beta-glucosidase
MHGVAATPAAAGALALRAGVDVDMVSAIYVDDLPPLVRAGKVPVALVDEAVRRVLRAKYKLGLFQDPYRYNDPQRERDSILTPAHIAAAREVARESIVLLKNERKVLPLSKQLGMIAVIGPLADDAESALGPWAAEGRPESVVTVLAGIRHAVSPQTKVRYMKGADVQGTDTSGFAEAVRLAREADAVVLVIGESRNMSGEANNRATLDLPGVQEALARAVYAAGRPTVVVLMNGRPLSVTWLAEHVPALVEAWYLGVQMGPAVADVLFGDVNPSGKLPVTFPRTVGQVPIYYNHKNTGRPLDPKKHYTSQYLDVPSTPLFPFGHGLSYTNFEYGDVRPGRRTMGASDTLTVQVRVTNTGRRAGDEVVQLYIRDVVASVTRPVKELRGFRRITLRPGESKTVTFTLGRDDLALYDASGKRVVEPGEFRVFVGTSSERVQEAHFDVVGESW